jgi:hypothetical protein
VVYINMFRYFGFGSNMNRTSLRAKGVEPLTAQRAVLRGWRLRFNVQHFFRQEGGVGNIERSDNPNDCVQGVLYECPDAALAPLDAVEAYGHGYDRISVNVDTHKGPVAALTYIGMPEFIDDTCLPSRRYLNIVVAGARSAGLDPEYVTQLAQQPTHQIDPYPIFMPPVGNYPIFTRASLAQYPLYTALDGAVFDMSAARPFHEYLKRFFGGKDMTLFHLKRLDCSDNSETMEDVRLGRFSQAQRQYLDGFLHEYAREYCYVGRFDYNED